MKPKKNTILHIITELGDGGAEAVVYRLCVNDSKYNHHVVSMKGMGKYGYLLESAGIKVHCLNMPMTGVVQSFLQLRLVISETNPDVIQTWMYHANLFGGVVARLTSKTKIVWGVRHSNLRRGTIKFTTIIVARLCAILSRALPEKIVSCAEEAVITHSKIGYAKERFVVIPNGYDLTRYTDNQIERQRLRKSWNISSGQVVFGMVARFDPQKDHVNLLMALRVLKARGLNFVCLLVGNGISQDNKTLTSMITNFELISEIRLLGPKNDIPSLMNSLDFHVLSSQGEAFPNVLAEAMACNIPCITTDVGDAALIVGNTGWVVPSKNHEALADAIEIAMLEVGKPDWLIRRTQARARIENLFELKKMIKSYDEVWTSCMR